MDEQVHWLVQLLESSLQSSGLSEREVEERLGWEPGMLGRIFAGSEECEPLQLVAILAELGTGHGGASHPPRRERGAEMAQDLIDRFRRLGYETPGAAAALPPPADQIEKTVEEVLRRTFGDLGKGSRGGG
ncbi:MAG TPA: hypothetical protein VEW48_14485 [Thermoanaerobaculia bacterium]|nr:hypothetical protein [Thermoanaerobaculia bacterium]